MSGNAWLGWLSCCGLALVSVAIGQPAHPYVAAMFVILALGRK